MEIPAQVRAAKRIVSATEHLVIKRARISFALALVVMTITALAAFAQNGGDDSVNRTIDKLLGDHRKYQRVILALQKAVINHAAAGVAAFVSYPIGVKLDGKTTIIRTPKAFIRDYDRIITPAIAGVIEQQKYGDFFINYQGVMFGRGEVWINGICADSGCKQFDVKVVTIQDTSYLDRK
jgi:hypothetical protein